MGLRKSRSIDTRELENRQWPPLSFPIGHEIIDMPRGESPEVDLYQGGWPRSVLEKLEHPYHYIPYADNYIRGCRVSEGRLDVIPFNDDEAAGYTLPPGECGITSLLNAGNGKIYGATSGARSHIFVYDPNQVDSRAVDLAVIDEPCRVRSLVVSRDGRVFGGCARENGGGHIVSINPEEPAPKAEKIPCPVEGEGVCALAADRQSDRVYGLSSVTGTLFIFHPDTGKCEIKGQVDEYGVFSKVMAITPNGDVYGGGRWGRLFKYESRTEKLVFPDAAAPSLKGREMYSEIESMVADGSGRFIFGGTSADGILFRFDIESGIVVSLGKPLNQPRIRCLALGADGCLYGIAGDKCCHLFAFRSDLGFSDLGVVYVSEPRHWHAYEFDAMAAGNNGEIYIGQNERVSYLFAYSPAS